MPLIEKHFEQIPALNMYLLMRSASCRLKAKILSYANENRNSSVHGSILEYPFFEACMNKKSVSEGHSKECEQCDLITAIQTLSTKSEINGKAAELYPSVKHCTKEKLLVSDRHVRCKTGAIVDNFEPIFNDPLFVSMLERVAAKEAELEAKGYVVFKHGQRFEYGLQKRWFTKLWGAINDQDVTDYLFVHVQQINKDQTRESDIRSSMIHHGADNEERLLFMNYPLFGNSTYPLCSSVHYAFSGSNQGHVSASLVDAFKCLGCQEIYDRYRHELEELESEYKNLSSRGSLLVIGVPERALVDSVYPTQKGGGRVCFVVDDHYETDILRVVNILRTNPNRFGSKLFPLDKTRTIYLNHAYNLRGNADGIEFGLIATQDEKGALNPKSGIKVFEFNSANPEKYAAFTKKEEALLAKIIQEIMQEKRGDKQQSDVIQNFDWIGVGGLLGKHLFAELSLE